MVDAFESLAPGDVVVTRPKRPEDTSKTLGDGWAPMLLLSNFRDNAGRRWAVAVPLEPSVGESSIGLDKLPQNMPNTALRTPLRSRMAPQAEHYAFLPLFQGPAPFLKNPGNASLSWGQAADPFAVRDAQKDVGDAHARGVSGYRIGVPEDVAQRTTAPMRTHNGATVAPSAPPPTDDIASMLPTPLRQAHALGMVKAEAHMAHVPSVLVEGRHTGPRTYGVPVASKPTVSITL